MSSEPNPIPSIEFCLKTPFSLDELKVLSACTVLRAKENWREKVLNEEIAQKWKSEAVEKNGFAEDLADWLIARLQWEASNPIPSSNDSTILPTAAPGVFESTDLIDPDLKQEFKQAFDQLLGSIPSGKRDYHPGTDEKVLNLIHPSLYPFVQDRTPMFPFSKELKIEAKEDSDVYSSFKNSVKTRNQAKISNALDPEVSILPDFQSYGSKKLEKVKFQWIPTDFHVSSSDRSVNFLGYINNLHPQPEKASGKLYGVLEKVLSKFIPLFESVLSEFPVNPTMKHEAWSWGFDPPRPEYEDQEEDGAFEQRTEQWENEAKFLPPKVEAFVAPEVKRFDLGGKNFQVIVKIASVELTPEKPEFEGGRWHVEGTGREKICATGIYYFENENVELPTLSFRAACVDDASVYEDEHPLSLENYGQDEHEHFSHIYGQSNFEPRISYLNSVQTEDGKCIAFPNGIQHKLSGFSLKDKTKKGHRRFLVFFLVDPTQSIPSTTEIPPQQSQWIFDEVDNQSGTHLSRLPIEMREVLYTSVDALSGKLEVVSEESAAKAESEGSDRIPYMSHEEALKVRLELMEERSNHAEQVEEAIKENTWSWCEH